MKLYDLPFVRETKEQDKNISGFLMSDNFYLKKISDRLSNSAKRREAKGRTLDDELRDAVRHGKKPSFNIVAD